MSLIRSEQLRFPLTGSFTGSFVGALSGSLTGTADTASYAHTASYVKSAQSSSYVSGSNVNGSVKLAETSSLTVTASYALTSSVTDFAVSASTALTASSADAFLVRGNLVVSGTTILRDLNVDIVSSSVQYSSGSNIFGNTLSNDQIFTGSVHITGALDLDAASKATIPNLTGSLYGTASWAINAVTAAYAMNVPQTSSYALQASQSVYATTASYALTVSGGGSGVFTGRFSGSFTGSAQGEFTGSLSGSVTGSLLGNVRGNLTGTASYTTTALTASYIDMGTLTGSIQNAVSSSYALNATNADGGQGNFTGSFTGSLLGSASYAFFANSGSYADRAGASDTAGTASWAQQAISSSTAESASIADKAISSSYSTSASAAEYSVNAGFASSSLSASYAATASLTDVAYTASYVATASTALFAISASSAVNALTSSYALTASVMVGGTASGQFSGSFEGNVNGTSSYSETSSYAYFLLDTASYAWTASYVNLAETASLVISASYAANSTTASHALTASTADYAASVSASNLVGYTDRIASGSGYIKFTNTASVDVKANLNLLETVSSSLGYIGYLHDTASQAETASYANSLRIKSGAVILDGGITIFTTSASLSGSEINNGLQFKNGGPTGDTWVIYSEDQDRSLRFGTTDATHSAYRINNYLHQVNADNPVNIFSTADGGGGIIMASLIYQGQDQPNQVWGQWTTTSSYTQWVTQSYIDNSGSFIGTASYAASVGAEAIKGDVARIASGSVTASISPNGGLQINTNTSITGGLYVSNTITASNIEILGTASIKYLHVEYETASIIVSTGSNKFGDAFNDVHQFTGSVGITGSFQISAATVATIPNLTGSLEGTASWALQAAGAGYADFIDGGFY